MDASRTTTILPPTGRRLRCGPVGTAPRRVRRLTSLRPGQAATVTALDDSLRGFTRRRCLDLGITPGTTVVVEAASLFRDPVAYRVRSTLIALRRAQAHCILIIPHLTREGNRG